MFKKLLDSLRKKLLVDCWRQASSKAQRIRRSSRGKSSQGAKPFKIHCFAYCCFFLRALKAWELGFRMDLGSQKRLEAKRPSNKIRQKTVFAKEVCHETPFCRKRPAPVQVSKAARCNWTNYIFAPRTVWYIKSIYYCYTFKKKEGKTVCSRATQLAASASRNHFPLRDSKVHD